MHVRNSVVDFVDFVDNVDLAGRLPDLPGLPNRCDTLFLLSEAKVIKDSTSNAFRISDLNRMNRLLPQHEHALEFQLCRTLRQALRRSQLFCDCLSAYLSHSVRKVTKGYQIMQLFFQLFFRFIKVSWHCQLFVIVFCT